MSDITELKPFLILCSLLALVPPYSFSKKAIVASNAYKCYALFLNMFMVFGYCYSLYGKLAKDMFHDYLETLKVIEHLTNISLNLTNMSAIVLSVFFNSKRLESILNGLDSFDVATKADSGIGKKRVWLTLVALHLVVVGFLLIDTMQWLSFVHFQMVKYYLPRNVFMYNFCMTVSLMIVLAIEIERRFKTLNELLRESFERRLRDDSKRTDRRPALEGYEVSCGSERSKINIEEWNDVSKVNKFGDYPDLNRIGKLHNFLCQIIDNFNGTYGFIILATVTFTIIIIVNYTALLMAFTVFRIELDVSTDQINLLYVSFFWIVGSMLQVSILATRCHSLATGANLTTEICYDLLNKIPSGASRTGQTRDLREGLTLIARQTQQRQPRISAAGFFEVNHDMCGFILSTVTSYIIVTIQFVAKEKQRY